VWPHALRSHRVRQVFQDHPILSVMWHTTDTVSVVRHITPMGPLGEGKFCDAAALHYVEGESGDYYRARILNVRT
jgi:hypothetical protein